MRVFGVFWDRAKRHKLVTGLAGGLLSSSPVWHLVGRAGDVDFLVSIGRLIGSDTMTQINTWGPWVSLAGGIFLLSLLIIPRPKSALRARESENAADYIRDAVATPESPPSTPELNLRSMSDGDFRQYVIDLEEKIELTDLGTRSGERSYYLELGPDALAVFDEARKRSLLTDGDRNKIGGAPSIQDTCRGLTIVSRNIPKTTGIVLAPEARQEEWRAARKAFDEEYRQYQDELLHFLTTIKNLLIQSGQRQVTSTWKDYLPSDPTQVSLDFYYFANDLWDGYLLDNEASLKALQARFRKVYGFFNRVYDLMEDFPEQAPAYVDDEIRRSQYHALHAVWYFGHALADVTHGDDKAYQYTPPPRWNRLWNKWNPEVDVPFGPAEAIKAMSITPSASRTEARPHPAPEGEGP